MPQAFKLGHSAYPGSANSPAYHQSHGRALADLLSRGVPMTRAQAALKSAARGSHVTTRTRRDHTVEVIALAVIPNC